MSLPRVPASPAPAAVPTAVRRALPAPRSRRWPAALGAPLLVLALAGCGSLPSLPGLGGGSAAAKPAAPSADDLQYQKVIELEKKKDLVGALALLQPLADKGHLNSVHYLGESYRVGDLVPKDLAKAVALYRQAGEAGHVPSMRRLAVMVEKGEGTAPDVAEAYRWMAKAAAAGDAASINDEGVMIEQGRGVPKNPKEAAWRYLKAAQAGNVTAMNNVGIAYQEGLFNFGQRDDKAAAGWFIQAAVAGHQGARERVAKAGYRSPDQMLAALNTALEQRNRRGGGWRAANYKHHGDRGAELTLFSQGMMQGRQEVSDIIDVTVYRHREGRTVVAMEVKKSALNAGYTARQWRDQMLAALGVNSLDPNYVEFTGDAK